MICYDKKKISNELQYVFLFVCLSVTIMSTKPISCHRSLCIPPENKKPENIRKPEIFLCFHGV